MLRSLFLFLCVSALCAQAQQVPVHYPDDGNTVTTAEQLRRVPPPNANSSVTDLESEGDMLRAQKDYPDAIDYYTAAIAKTPTASVYNKRGIAKLQMLRLDEAKKDFEKAIKIEKDYPEAHNNLGAVLYSRKDYSGAIKHYKKAIEKRPTASFYSNLGTAYFARKWYDKAQESYMQALQLDADVFEHQRNAAGTQLYMANTFERGKFNYVVAKMYAARGDSERCLLYLQKAMEEGYPVAKELPKDREFAAFRDDSRVKQLLASKPVTVN